MYADRYAPRRVNRGSLTLSTAICGALLAAALLSPTVIRHAPGRDSLPTWNVPEVPTPPPLPEPKPVEQHRAVPAPRPDAPQPFIPPTPAQPAWVEPGPVLPLDPGPGTLDTGTGTGPVIADPPAPPRPPVLTAPGVDPRFAGDFQPGYPPAERRAGREGAVVVRVLVGVDGRVRDAVQVSAASPEFWRVTRDRALARWRFRPATRDGIPVEAWRTMTVRFVLHDGN